jgi:hypothetical protein
MIDLAAITVLLARDRVADQFAGPAASAAASRVRVRRAGRANTPAPERVQTALPAATST